jgi:hypothetical protein
MTEEFPFTKGWRRQKRLTRRQRRQVDDVLRRVEWPEITEERIERAMRVSSPEEVMDFLLRCTQPRPDAGIERWVRLVARLRSGPQTPATARAIAESERELTRRVGDIPTDCAH